MASGPDPFRSGALRREEAIVLRVHHVQIAIPAGKEPEADAFYGGVLGLRGIEKPANLRHLGGLWFACRASPVQLHLGVEEPFSPAKKAHPALVVDDIAIVEEALESAGFPVAVETELEGYRRFYTEDPFGNRLEILGEEPGATGA